MMYLTAYPFIDKLEPEALTFLKEHKPANYLWTVLSSLLAMNDFPELKPFQQFYKRCFLLKRSNSTFSTGADPFETG